MSADAKRVQAIFRVVADIADDAERAELLDRECASDVELRRQVEDLLRVYRTPAGDRAEEDLDPEVTRNLRAEANAGSDLTFLEPSDRSGTLGRLGHYEVREVLGRGGFGIVLKAFDEKLQRVVAIKVMAPHLATTSPARKRFLREARAAARVRHENVVQIYAVEETPIPYLVMEYIPGETLQQYLDRVGPLDVRDVLSIGTQIARGLAAAHEQGLIHRDIKPANILLEKESAELRARLTDFGLARSADDASLTQSGTVAGTPLFMSPEQARGERVDARADLFSLGSVLYVMVSGRPPFRATTALAVLQRVTTDTPRAIREIVPETPQWLCEIIDRLLAKQPDQRFATAREVADLLAECGHQLRHSGRPNVRLSSNRPTAQSRWLRGGVAVLIVGLLVLLGLLAFGLLRYETSPPEKTPPGDPHKAALPPGFTNDSGMAFVLVPKGTAWLGGGDGVAGERFVEIPNAFYLGIHEVTQHEWESLMGAARNPSHFSRNGEDRATVAHLTDAEIQRLPVDSVSWTACQEFLKRLNARLSARPQEQGWVYRLPTSQEWEYACRGGPMATVEEAGFHFYLATPTNTLPVDRANFKETALNRTRAVGSYPPNRLGLHDMHGNVFEICHEIRNPEGDALCILRGGGWLDEADSCRANNINLGIPSAGYNGSGLRLARVPVTPGR